MTYWPGEIINLGSIRNFQLSTVLITIYWNRDQKWTFRRLKFEKVKSLEKSTEIKNS